MMHHDDTNQSIYQDKTSIRIKNAIRLLIEYVIEHDATVSTDECNGNVVTTEERDTIEDKPSGEPINTPAEST